ncbi:MAG TPA: hypothetical protein VK021_09645 [Flavobacteriaceae bacterium]|nr:hypothetical protein [Flavobacteriaceae bacterium]
MKKIDLKVKLRQQRDKFTSGEELLQDIKDLLQEDDAKDQEILQEIIHGEIGSDSNQFDLDLLATENIFHEDQIKRICIIYRLRFLESRLFKDELPYEAISKIKQLQKEHKTTLNQFRILAPAKAFRLKNADDPLLFAPIGNGYYYLIHKWGNDLSMFRKIRVWPYRGLGNMAVFIFLISLIFVALVPERFTNGPLTPPKFLFFAFIMAQWFGGFMLFFMIKKGKNFSGAVWKSKFINA